MKRVFSVAFVALAIVAIVALTGCSSGYSAKPEIHITAKGFVPAQLVVKPGTVVKWINDSTEAHAVQANDFESEAIYPGQSYTNEFTDAGTFPYYCRYHVTEKGTVVVK